MHCPSCRRGALKPDYLEEGLSCRTCNQCDGSWLLLEDYSDWLNQDELLESFESVESDDMSPIEDSKQVLLCPISKTLMIKYRVSKDHPFQLDFSKAVNGIWFDQEEWEAIKEAGLSHQLKRILSPAWQKEIRSQYVVEQLESRYRNYLGEADYQKAVDFRKWLESHDKAGLIRAYINQI